MPSHSALRTVVQPEHSRLVRYGVAVLAVLLGLGLMLLLDPWISMKGSPFVVFFAAVMISAWYGGLGPGILATLLSTLAAKYFFISLIHAWQVANLADLARLILFVLVSLMVSSLSAVRRQLVKALRTERDLVSAVVSTAGSLIVVLDRQGRIVEFNRACERTTGYSFEEVRGKHPWDLLLPMESVEFSKEAFQKLRAGFFPSEYEGVWITRQGDRRFIAWSNTVLLDDWGFARFIVSTGIDITERKQAEQNLQETNQTLQTLVQSSPLAIAVLDRVGRVKLWNPASERMFGWSQEEVQGQVIPIVADDQWAEFQTNLESTLRGEVLNGVEIHRQRKDRSPIAIGLWTAMLRGSRAQDDSILAIMADLSDRKQAEAALKLSQERLTSFFESNIIGIVFADINGGIEQANDAFLRMVGYTQADIESGCLRWNDITPPESLEIDAWHIAEARQRGACTPYEKEFIHKNGSRVPVLVGFTLLGEDRTQAISFVLDLTERKRLERTLRRQTEKLAEANRMKDEFLAVLSHELRTPLNSMLGWSRLLRTRQLDAATTARALETIERNARLQAQLIEDILDVSKMIRGKLRLQPRPARLEPVLIAAVDAMRPAAEAKKVQLQCSFDSGIGNVLGDPDRLQQVFWNLLSNAIKFTPEGGQVQVRLTKIRATKPSTESRHPLSSIDYAQVQVIDTGKGISADFLPFVFDRFRQADSSITRPDGGLGLGLSIVRHLIELHGGSVWAESPGLGQGATFTVRLPLLGDRTPHMPEQSITGIDSHGIDERAREENHAILSSAQSLIPTSHFAQGESSSSGILAGLRILLVDDEADVRDILRAAMEHHGATVAVATSATEAFNLIASGEENDAPESWKPDVLVSDIAMPFEDGCSLIRKVRDLQATRGTFTPALALTAFARRENLDESLENGFQLCLSKPIDPNSLVTAIADLMGRSGEVDD
ncbi:PAS domain S-box protein [Leptothermofonsia sp. ETS-13]|uniref:PAS domain S-box protein n=1 Tax=Leptothermofonsia sp. ETS-13 TaxID=3035696 RepID=UPI003BA1D803